MNNKPYILNLKPFLYISLYTKKKCTLINNLIVIISFKKSCFYLSWK